MKKTNVSDKVTELTSILNNQFSGTLNLAFFKLQIERLLVRNGLIFSTEKTSDTTFELETILKSLFQVKSKKLKPFGCLIV